MDVEHGEVDVGLHLVGHVRAKVAPNYAAPAPEDEHGGDEGGRVDSTSSSDSSGRSFPTNTHEQA